MSTGVEINHVTKRYKNGVLSLNDITLNIGTGVFGLLGHNGAGKSTLMKIIATIYRPTQGEVKVCGHDCIFDGQNVRSCIGYLPQELNMYKDVTVKDFVTYIGMLKGNKSSQSVSEVLKQVDMYETRKRKIKELSGGMKRRVGIAQALIGNPQVLIVDEPTAGLDPEERVKFRGILSRFAKNNKTIILSTHIVEDVYQICNQIAVLREGNLFFHGKSEELREIVKDKVKCIVVKDESFLSEIHKNAVIISTTYNESGIKVRVVDENGFYRNIKPELASLEDAYVYCMGGSKAE